MGHVLTSFQTRLFQINKRIRDKFYLRVKSMSNVTNNEDNATEQNNSDLPKIENGTEKEVPSITKPTTTVYDVEIFFLITFFMFIFFGIQNYLQEAIMNGKLYSSIFMSDISLKFVIPFISIFFLYAMVLIDILTNSTRI